MIAQTDSMGGVPVLKPTNLFAALSEASQFVPQLSTP